MEIYVGKGKGEWVGNTIAQAKVRNVAITNVPVNKDARLEILSKSLQVIEETEDFDILSRLESLEKALTMGTATEAAPEQAPEGPRTGEGAGKILTEESLEEDEKDLTDSKKRAKKSGGNGANLIFLKYISDAFGPGCGWWSHTGGYC